MSDFLHLTPEQLAALPPEVQQILHQKLLALLAELGVKPLVTPDGVFAVDLRELAPSLGLSVQEAQEHLDEVGMQGTDRDDLVALQ